MPIIEYFFAVFKNVIYGLSIYFTQDLSVNVDVLDILALRFLMSAAVMWLLKITHCIKINVGVNDLFVKTERTPYLKNLLLTALFEPVLYMLFETTGLSMTTGITAGVILSLSPIAICICEMIFLKEKTSFMEKLFLFLGIIGVIYIGINTNTTDGRDTVLGIMLIVFTVISGALFIVFSRKSSKAFSAMEITYVSALMGMVAFNIANVVRHIYAGDILSYFVPFFNINNMIGFIFLAVISTIVATGMNNRAVSKLQASTVAAFGGVSTLTAIIAGIILGGEKLYYFHWIGIILILIRMIGVSYIQIKKQRKKINENIHI